MSKPLMGNPFFRFLVALVVFTVSVAIYWLLRAEISETVPLDQPVVDLVALFVAGIYVLSGVFSRKVASVGFALAVTGLLCGGTWWLWNAAPGFLRRTELSDFSYVASLVLVVAVLSVINPVLGWVWAQLEGGSEDH